MRGNAAAAWPVRAGKAGGGRAAGSLQSRAPGGVDEFRRNSTKIERISRADAGGAQSRTIKKPHIALTQVERKAAQSKSPTLH